MRFTPRGRAGFVSHDGPQTLKAARGPNNALRPYPLNDSLYNLLPDTRSPFGDQEVSDLICSYIHKRFDYRNV